MPAPAPKPLSEELFLLFSHLNSGERLGDIRRFQIRTKLEACLHSSAADSHCGLAILAAMDGDEIAMRNQFDKVFEAAPGEPGYEYNWGLLLMLTSHPDEAIKTFMQSLNHGLADPSLLNSLAEHAIMLADADLQFKVLDRANKLQCDGPGILRLAALICCANSDDPREKANMLELAFPDDELRKNSELITDEEWDEMQKLADDLRRYL